MCSRASTSLLVIVVFALSSWLGDDSAQAQLCFEPSPFVPVGDRAVGLVTGDWNEDGHPDLASCDSDNDQLKLLLGNGFGDFTSTVTIDLLDGPAQALETGDFDGDSHQDFLVVIAQWDEPENNRVRVWFGDGNGAFDSGPEFAIPEIVHAIVEDWNRDGRDDFVVASSPGLVSFYFSVPGGFAAPMHQAMFDPFSHGIAAADFDADGNPDLVTSDGDGALRIYRGVGAGLFLVTTLSVPPAGLQPRVGDLNGDGLLDLVSLGSDRATVTRSKSISATARSGSRRRRSDPRAGSGTTGSATSITTASTTSSCCTAHPTSQSGLGSAAAPGH